MRIKSLMGEEGLCVPCLTSFIGDGGLCSLGDKILGESTGVTGGDLMEISRVADFGLHVCGGSGLFAGENFSL